MTNKRLGVLVATSSLLVSCTLREFTTDISRQSQGLTAVDHCFALRKDAYVLMSPARVTIDRPRPTELDVFGYISIEPNAAQDPRQKFKLTAGTHVAVKRVLSHYYPMVGHVIKPYIRIEGQFDNRYIDSSTIFELTTGSEPVLPIPAYLGPCNSEP